MLDLFITLIIFPLIVRIFATIFEWWWFKRQEDD